MTWLNFLILATIVCLPWSLFAAQGGTGTNIFGHVRIKEGWSVTFGGASRTNWPSGGTADHTALTNQNGDTNFLHLSTLEKIIATNVVDLAGGTNIAIRGIGTTNVTIDLQVGTNGIMIGTNKWIAITTNDTVAIWYWREGSWSNAFEVVR